MHKKVVASVVLALAMVGMLFVWLGRDEPDIVGKGSVPAPISEDSRKVDIQAAPEQTAVVNDKQSNEVVGVSTPPPSTEATAQKTAPQLSPGHYRRMISLELTTYFSISSVGSRGYMPAPIIQQYNLSAKEVAQLVDYAKVAYLSDRANQTRMHENICASRSTYQTLEKFGKALNDFNTEAEAHQESLGRDARIKLDPDLYGKLNSMVLARSPPRELVFTDFSQLLVQQNRDLQTEIERFCKPRTDVEPMG